MRSTVSPVVEEKFQIYISNDDFWLFLNIFVVKSIIFDHNSNFWNSKNFVLGTRNITQITPDDDDVKPEKNQKTPLKKKLEFEKKKRISGRFFQNLRP